MFSLDDMSDDEMGEEEEESVDDDELDEDDSIKMETAITTPTSATIDLTCTRPIPPQTRPQDGRSRRVHRSHPSR